jgi:hypothetical protein
VAAIARRAAELAPRAEEREDVDELFELIDAAAHLKPATASDAAFLLMVAHERVSVLQQGDCWPLEGKEMLAELDNILERVAKLLLRGGQARLDPALAGYFWSAVEAAAKAS